MGRGASEGRSRRVPIPAESLARYERRDGQFAAVNPPTAEETRHPGMARRKLNLQKGDVATMERPAKAKSSHVTNFF